MKPPCTSLRWLSWMMGISVALAIAAYGLLVHSVSRYEPGLLLACANVETQPVAWTCKHRLRYGGLSPDQVRSLNSEAGALLPVLIEQPALAEEMLILFLKHGVDINAGDPRVKNTTALHTMASSGDVVRVRLLLRHGARTDIVNANGRTPADHARSMIAKWPGDPRWVETLQLLEDAQPR